MPESAAPREGYLVLADLSGYTRFLAGTELDHATGILTELCAVITDALAPPLRFVKLEGDAVFCYAETPRLAEGERLLELIEVCYQRFADRRFDMARETTCPCAACAAIETLDLKFVGHFGTFIVQRVGEVDDLIGADVIRVHRLLKNTVAEETGIPAYALLTDACLACMPRGLTPVRHKERHEALGSVTGGVFDLHEALVRLRQEQREFVRPEDAHLTWAFASPLPPPVLWQYCVDPAKRLRWQTAQKAITNTPNANGRQGVGGTSHCVHRAYELRRHYVDWRPFTSFTCRVDPVRRWGYRLTPWLETTELQPADDGGTRYEMRVQFQGGGVKNRIGLPLLRPIFRRQFREFERNLVRIGAEDGLTDPTELQP